MYVNAMLNAKSWPELQGVPLLTNGLEKGEEGNKWRYEEKGSLLHESQ